MVKHRWFAQSPTEIEKGLKVKRPFQVVRRPPFLTPLQVVTPKSKSKNKSKSKSKNKSTNKSKSKIKSKSKSKSKSKTNTTSNDKSKSNGISDTIISTIAVYAVCAIYTVLSESCKCWRLRARAIAHNIHNIPCTYNIKYARRSIHVAIWTRYKI